MDINLNTWFVLMYLFDYKFVRINLTPFYKAMCYGRSVMNCTRCNIKLIFKVWGSLRCQQVQLHFPQLQLAWSWSRPPVVDHWFPAGADTRVWSQHTVNQSVQRGKSLFLFPGKGEHEEILINSKAISVTKRGKSPLPMWSYIFAKYS